MISGSTEIPAHIQEQIDKLQRVGNIGRKIQFEPWQDKVISDRTLSCSDIAELLGVSYSTITRRRKELSKCDMKY